MAKSVASPFSMSPLERRASGWLASIYALRMFGLFLIFPIFAIYGKALEGGQEKYLIALAVSIYGLTQAFLQIAYGSASDRFGRKPVIIFGLILFALGGAIAAMSTHIMGVIAGRALQGAGAVSAAVTAFIADHTRDEVRTKAMAMVGMSIGLTFAAAMVIAPPLAAWIGLSGIFWLTTVLALCAIIVIMFAVPDAPTKAEPAETIRHGDVLFNPQLFRLNLGVFVLHATMTGLFLLIPTKLIELGGLLAPEHWKVYLPVVVLSFFFMVPLMIVAEKRGYIRPIFLCAIALLFVTLLSAPLLSEMALKGLVIFLFLFFVAFNLLEAMQPSLVSRLAPPQLKGFAIGVYNTTQSLGLALGGILAGAVTKRLGDNSVFYVCAGLTALWFLATFNMQPPSKSNPQSEK